MPSPKLTAAARRALALMQEGWDLGSTARSAELMCEEKSIRTSLSVVDQLDKAGLIDGHYHNGWWWLTDKGRNA